MTEELEKNAEEYISDNCKRWEFDGLTVDDIANEAYLAGAEPREKRIAELEDKLANADYQLEGRDNEIRELEAQIEKMKCCGNCENRYGQEKCKDCHNYSKWKFKQAEQFYEEIVE